MWWLGHRKKKYNTVGTKKSLCYLLVKNPTTGRGTTSTCVGDNYYICLLFNTIRNKIMCVEKEKKLAVDSADDYVTAVDRIQSCTDAHFEAVMAGESLLPLQILRLYPHKHRKK